MNAAAHQAAVDGAAIFDRSGRTRLRVSGRAPRQMLNGILTGTIPPPPAEVEPGVLGGTATYHAVLTPKGKMITDLWAFLTADEEEQGFWLDVPAAGRDALLENFRRVLPPRFAKVEDASPRTDMLAVTGAGAAVLLSRLALGLRVEPEALEALDEGEWRMTRPSEGDGLVVARTRDVAAEAWLVLGDAAAVRALRGRLLEAGAVEGTDPVWTTLRVEAGRPEFGVDMGDDTIPVEAGVHDRAIDYQKGCYTGQEVIVRIRDRGRVNRHLRRLVLGDAPVPEAGTELHAPGDEGGRAVGRITSAVRSPALGQTIALAYVRRDVPAVSIDGREVTVG